MRCKICNNNKTYDVLNLKKQPLANKYPKNKLEIKKEYKFNLKVCFCEKCKSAQIKKIIDRKLMFTDYYYLSSINKGLVEHFDKLAKKLKNSNFVLDIGSNDGVLLAPLKKLGIKAIGVDPSVNVGKIANKKGLKTIIDFFNVKVIEKITKAYSKPDTIVASSVITHLEKPIEFAKNIKKILKDNGILILEIEYLLNFIKNLEYERFYFDRPFYYSLKSIEILFKSVGMSLIDVEKINIHGGSLRCYIKNSKNFKQSSRCKKILNIEMKRLNKNLFKKFNLNILNESKKLKNKLLQLKKNNKFVIGYGAPARVATITNYQKINSKFINYIIDDNPLKQNKYSPGSHIKIVAMNKLNISKADIVIVFAYEYFSDIRKKFKSKKIKFFKPIPFKELS